MQITSDVKRTCRRAALVLLALLPALPAPAAVSVVAPEGSEGWHVRSADGVACVVDRREEHRACWSEPWQVTDLRETPRGWIAAGHHLSPEGRDLVLREGADGELRALEPPAGVVAPRGRPQLVTDGAQLLGVVWLEGRRQETMTVRSAEWLGGGWSEPAMVSGVGPGSQLAPTVTVLDDGRWLALWTAFDGRDDETLWSVFAGDRWTPPLRVHEDNATPDILPAVLATREGAVAAWSWLDGRDYRLRIAHFDGRAWTLSPAGEGRGADGPALLAVGGSTLLVTNTVVPREWLVLELDARGRVLRRAAAAVDRPDPPTVEPLGGGVLLRWPGDAALELFAPWGDAP